MGHTILCVMSGESLLSVFLILAVAISKILRGAKKSLGGASPSLPPSNTPMLCMHYIQTTILSSENNEVWNVTVSYSNCCTVCCNISYLSLYIIVARIR